MSEIHPSDKIEIAALTLWKTYASDEAFLLKRLEKHHPQTFMHSIRVAYYSFLVGQSMGLSDQQKRVLWKSAVLHDIGKLMIPEEVLNKTEALNEQEWQMIRDHCINGAEIVEHCQLSNLDLEVIRYHHENLDGTGYYGLTDSKLNLFTRIVRVVDSYDAMTEARGYNLLRTKDSALDELYRWNEIFYDPMVVKTFHHIIQRSASPSLRV